MNFPNLPYFVDTNGYKMSESGAIVLYICEKWNPALVGATPEERGEAGMVYALIHELKLKVHGLCVTSDPTDESKETIKNMVLEGIKPYATRLDNKEFVMGNTLNYVDFLLYETIQFFDFCTQGEIFSRYPSFEPYV